MSSLPENIAESVCIALAEDVGDGDKTAALLQPGISEARVIAREEGEDVFVHYTNIEGDGFRCLKNGQTVEYEEQSGDKGLFGVQVRVLSDDEWVATDDEEELKFF